MKQLNFALVAFVNFPFVSPSKWGKSFVPLVQTSVSMVVCRHQTSAMIDKKKIRNLKFGRSDSCLTSASNIHFVSSAVKKGLDDCKKVDASPTAREVDDP